MKIATVACCIALLAGGAFSLSLHGQQPPAAPSKLTIAVVSPQRILTDSMRGRTESARAQALQQQKTNELRTKQQNLEALRQQIVQTTDAAARLQLQQQELQQRQELERATTQAQVELQALQRQLNAELLASVRTIIDDLSKIQNIDMVINGDASVVWAKAELDLTNSVIARMNGR